MKRCFVLLTLLALIVIVPIASFAVTQSQPDTDYSKMTDEELINEFIKIKEELSKRGLDSGNDSKNIILIDIEGVVVSIAGDLYTEEYYNGKTYLKVPVLVENNSNRDVRVYFKRAIVNGWDVDGYAEIYLDAGTKSKGEFGIVDIYGKTDITSISDIKKIVFISSITSQDLKVTYAKDIESTVDFE